MEFFAYLRTAALLRLLFKAETAWDGDLYDFYLLLALAELERMSDGHDAPELEKGFGPTILARTTGIARETVRRRLERLGALGYVIEAERCGYRFVRLPAVLDAALLRVRIDTLERMPGRRL